MWASDGSPSFFQLCLDHAQLLGSMPSLSPTILPKVPRLPQNGPTSLYPTKPPHHVGVGWVVRWPGAASPGHLFASTLAYVYMRAALAVLGTAIRARPHLPATPGLGSDICLSLIFKSHPSLWYPAKGSTLASIWLGVGAYCALGGGYSGPSSTVLGPREVAKPTPVSLALNTPGTAMLPWAPSPKA